MGIHFHLNFTRYFLLSKLIVVKNKFTTIFFVSLFTRIKYFVSGRFSYFYTHTDTDTYIYSIFLILSLNSV